MKYSVFYWACMIGLCVVSIDAGEKDQAQPQSVSWSGKAVLWAHATTTQGLIYCAPPEWDGGYENMAWVMLSVGMGGFLGTLKISPGSFMQALPVYSLGTLGAAAGRCGAAWLGLSEEQTSLLATTGACAGGGVGYGLWRVCSQAYQRRQAEAQEKHRAAAAALDLQYKRAQEEVDLRNLVEGYRHLNNEMEADFRRIVEQPD